MDSVKSLQGARRSKQGIVSSAENGESATLSMIYEVVPLVYMSFRKLCFLIVSLPVLGMFTCFVSAVYMHGDALNRTRCPVYNFIPSISAITGVSPQRYIWRICMAFHVAPRFLVSWTYRAHYNGLLSTVPEERRGLYSKLVTLSYWLHNVELFALVAVTYVSNKENYPIHEKCFVTFLTMAISNMLVIVFIEKILKRSSRGAAGERTGLSYKRKLRLFACVMILTSFLLYFFYQHRFLCKPLAFSWFSLTEYVLASTIMVFHMMVVLDFPDEILMVGRPILGLSDAEKSKEPAALSHRVQTHIGVSEDDQSSDSERSTSPEQAVVAEDHISKSKSD